MVASVKTDPFTGIKRKEPKKLVMASGSPASSGGGEGSTKPSREGWEEVL